MRITNNMIMGNTKTNINSTKVLVDKYNTQMTTQKKISKASEDPVIAIRSLRLSTSLSHLDQYKDNNIPDASSCMDVTETALSNMKSLLTDIRTQCVNGSTDTLTADDRNTRFRFTSAFYYITAAYSAVRAGVYRGQCRLRRKNGIYGLPHIIKAHIPEGHKEHISDNTGVFCR